MSEFFGFIKKKYKVVSNHKCFWFSLFISFCILVGGVVAVFYASQFNDTFFYPPVGDLILDNIDTYDLSFWFTYGVYMLIGFIFLYVILLVPERLPFVFKTYGLLLFVRAIFILLTNFGPPVGFFYGAGAPADNYLLQNFLFRNDLFFSGHVALPFIGYLLLRGTNRVVELIILIGSFVMAVTVLLMHVHYSIDVFAAFFITYGVYSLSNEVFGRINERIFGWRGFCCEHKGSEVILKTSDKNK
ncbi:hypothetical protein M0P48_05730 [Candidatus Gracilibacteria bacterium]|nr:hypothetical protein [Candidatus Gracilibacteria bacterium]